MTTRPTDPAAPGFRSEIIRRGTIRATTRSFLHALGQDDEDIARPHIGVFHTGGEMSPCNLNLRDQAQHAKTGIYAAGGTPQLGAEYTTYRQWAQLLADRADGAELSAQGDYWKAQLAARKHR